MLSVTVIILFLLSATCSGGVFYNYPHQANSRPHQGPRRFGHLRNWQHTHAPYPVTNSHRYAENFYYLGTPDIRPELANGNELQELQRNLQVIFVKPPEQNDYRNNFKPVPAFHTAAQPQSNIYVLNRQPNIVGVAHRIPTTQASGCQQTPAEVNFIKYLTVPEPQAAVTRYETSSGGLERGRTNHGGRTEAAESMAPGLNVRYIQWPFSPAVGQQSYDFAPLPVDKNYAINYLPMGIDVVPGSSYLPLRKRRWIENSNKSPATNESSL